MPEWKDEGPAERGDRDPERRPERREQTEAGAGDEAERRAREIDAAFRRAREPSDLPPDVIRERMQAMRDTERQERAAAQQAGENPERVHHAGSRHQDISDHDLKKRLDGPHGIHHSTRFTSKEALVMAEGKAWRSPDAALSREAMEKLNAQVPEAERVYSFSVRMSAKELLGSQWREHLEGWSRSSGGPVPTEFPNHTNIFVQWRPTSTGEWAPYTCHPSVTNTSRKLRGKP